MQFPAGLSPEVVEKVKDLYAVGIAVTQKSLELLGQLDAYAAVDCLTTVLAQPSANKVELLKELINVKLSSAIPVDTAGIRPIERTSEEPAQKRAKVG